MREKQEWEKEIQREGKDKQEEKGRSSTIDVPVDSLGGKVGRAGR